MPRASIIWLAPAVKVVRPVTRRLHLDCVRCAKDWHLGITLGVCLSVSMERFHPACEPISPLTYLVMPIQMRCPNPANNTYCQSDYWNDQNCGKHWNRLRNQFAKQIGKQSDQTESNEKRDKTVDRQADKDISFFTLSSHVVK